MLKDNKKNSKVVINQNQFIGQNQNQKETNFELEREPKTCLYKNQN